MINQHFDFAVDLRVSVAIILADFGVTDDHVFNQFTQHRRRNTARKSALQIGMDVLRADFDRGPAVAADNRHDRRDRQIGWAQYPLGSGQLVELGQ